jgi:hypothetical protein
MQQSEDYAEGVASFLEAASRISDDNLPPAQPFANAKHMSVGMAQVKFAHAPGLVRVGQTLPNVGASPSPTGQLKPAPVTRANQVGLFGR